VSIVDEHAFGDLKSFREQFASLSQARVFAQLKARLAPLCHRTLRRQVTAYVPFTKRHAMVEEFTPAESEDQLYELVSEYLRRPNLQALPASQRALMTLVLRKLLASSTFAIAGALGTMAARLRARLVVRQPEQANQDDLAEDYEGFEETAEEWSDDGPPEPLSPEDRAVLLHEIEELESFARLATSIDHNAKGQALLRALRVAFVKAKELGAPEKAIIFTESRRTQSYLLRVLADSPWQDGIVLFNGSNTDERSKALYAAWLERHRGSDRVTGSRSADMRSALVDYFRDEGRIMIATEAGAEGINLQFCSLVVNYDLPWNPQRIEQRIGRCHRYGQKHDVVVVNFLNRKNAADRRVYELLAEKFHLFEGIFGASDEVLGAIESGVDFEKRIHDIYQRCRKTEEIKAAFDQLQLELGFEIDEAMSDARRKLLEHFDDEVREKLRVRDEDSRAVLDRFERMLMQLTRHELRDQAEMVDDSSFHLRTPPPGVEVATGLYELPRRSGEAHLYRLGHPLAEHVVTQAKARVLPAVEIRFAYDAHVGRITALEQFRGSSGHLCVELLTIEALDQSEDRLVVAAVADSGAELEDDIARRLLLLSARLAAGTPIVVPPGIEAVLERRTAEVRGQVSERNARFFEAEGEKLDGWADDLKAGLEREIKELDRQIKEARRAAKLCVALEDKLAGQKKIKALETERNEKRRSLFDAQDRIDAQREELIAGIEAKLAQKTSVQRLLAIRWVLE